MFFSRYFFLVISQIIILLGCSAANLQEFSLETPAQILILLGYSKGATDILHFLVDYPEIAKK